MPVLPELPRSVGAGTFRRGIAQVRPTLSFFNLGHPLFDAVLEALFREAAGRTYAVDVRLPKELPWTGFEFVFTAAPNLGVLGGNLGLLNQARQLFVAQPLHLFYRHLDRQPELDGSRLLRLRRALDRGGKDSVWENLTKMKVDRLEQAFVNEGWLQTVYDLHGRARVEARRRFEGLLQEQLDREQVRLATLVRQAEASGGDDLPALR